MDWTIKIRLYGVNKLARDLGVTKQAVSRWLSTRKIPAERVPDVARLVQVPRAQLRPDIFE